MSLFCPTRRDLLKLGAVAPALAMPSGLRALDAPDAGNPGYARFAMGQARLTILSDGHLSLPTTGLGVNADPAEVQAFLARHFLPTDMTYSHTNHLVVELGEAVVLVDVGSGNRFLDSAGRLWDNLAAAGIDPATVTHVVITHAHPDHIWGIRDDFDEAILPDAQYFVGRTEREFWLQDGLAARLPAEMQQMAVGAVNSLMVDGAEWTLTANDSDIAPGIRVIDTPGHTPGHQSVVVESDGQQLIAVGDALSHVWTNFAHPGWINAFDMDGAQTVASRTRLLDMAAADGMAVLGYHFPFPGIGHVLRDGDAFRFVPAMIQW